MRKTQSAAAAKGYSLGCCHKSFDEESLTKVLCAMVLVTMGALVAAPSVQAAPCLVVTLTGTSGLAARDGDDVLK